MLIVFMNKFTVKAREHRGTNSLDLTIPTKIVKDNKISSGDIFEIIVIKDNDKLKIEYCLVYSKN